MKYRSILGLIVVGLLALTGTGNAADVVSNGTFDSGINGWAAEILSTGGTRSWDGVVFGNASGSIKYVTDQIISGTVINIFAGGITAFASQKFLQPNQAFSLINYFFIGPAYHQGRK